MSSATAAPLFGGSSRGSSNKYLVEFRAGKMQLKSGNMVHPDKRKGLVYIYQADDALMHFCWKDRTSGNVEDDLIIFPDDVEYKKVAQCTTGRVYILKFKSSNKKFFFWMQEPKTDKDDDYCSKVNEYLNNPPQGGNVSSSSGVVDRDLHSILSNMDQQQLLQLFGNTQQLSSLLGSGRSGGSTRERIRDRFDRSERENRSSSTTTTTTTTATTTTAATTTTTAASATTTSPPALTTTATTTTAAPTTATATTPTTSSTPAATTTTATEASASGAAGVEGPIKLSDLHNILQKIILPPGSERQPTAELSTAFNAETLQPILSNPDFLERLRPFLPNTGESDMPTADQLKDTVHSPQFQQAMSLFTSALSSGQLGPLMQQFGLGEDAVNAANKGDMEAFLKALQKKDKKDDDDGMALD